MTSNPFEMLKIKQGDTIVVTFRSMPMAVGMHGTSHAAISGTYIDHTSEFVRFSMGGTEQCWPLSELMIGRGGSLAGN